SFEVSFLMSRDFKKKPIWPALSSGSKRKGRPPFHSLRSFHYERPFLSLAADAAFTETMLRYRWESKLDKTVNRIYKKNGYRNVIQPNHIWKKNRITELIDDGHPPINVASWMGDTVKMIEKVYKGFVRATRVAGRASVDSEWNSDAFELVQNAS
ncbi:MAG: hypothetical protein ABGZ35_17680, partial [Planctomycetaceae bacterium]